MSVKEKLSDARGRLMGEISLPSEAQIRECVRGTLQLSRGEPMARLGVLIILSFILLGRFAPALAP